MEHTDSHDKEHYNPDCYECNKKDKLCPVCGAHLANWLEMFGEEHYCKVAKKL